mgnify:CR=1 FL=1
MKKLLSSLLAAALTAGLLVPSAGAVDTGFSDVPAESALAGEVRKAVDYGLMNGYDNDTFGYGDSMTRAQFTAVLVRMMGWDTVTPQTPTYTDVPASHTWYGVIETAAAHDVANDGGAFRPSDPVTRGEMAELLVRALGLKSGWRLPRLINTPAFTAARRSRTCPGTRWDTSPSPTPSA